MPQKKSSFFDSDSKWFNSTSIATYIIIVAVLVSGYYTGTLAYNIMFPEKVTGKTTIKGKVTAVETDHPIEGVLISLEGTNEATYTNMDGKYRLNDTEAGVQTLVFTKAGYRTRQVKYYMDKTDKDNPIDLEKIGLEPMPESVEILSIEGGSLSGTVFSHITNEPIQGAEVRINGSSLDYNDTEKKAILDGVGPVLTKEDGSFDIQGLRVGILELVVTVTFNESFAQENNNVKFYQEIVTFYVKAGENTEIDVNIQNPNLASDLFYPFTFVKRRSIISQHDLVLSFETPQQVADRELNITIYKHHTGELVETLKTKSRDDVKFTLEQGLYDIWVLCEDCRVTKVLNISVNGDTNKSIVVPFGDEPDFDDQTDTSGLLICLIPSIILIVVSLIGAYYAFTRKKFFIAVLGAIAVIPQQSLMLGIFSLNCISVNLILGIIAAVLIFRNRGQFLDSVAPQAGPGAEIEAKYEEIEEEKTPVEKEESPRKKKGKGKKGAIKGVKPPFGPPFD